MQKLTCSDYGVPQSRERLYLVAIHRAAQFAFPAPIPCWAVDLFIDVLPPGKFATHPAPGPKGGATKTNNVLRQLESCVEEGLNPFITPVFVNSGASGKRCNKMIGKCMTITRTEASRQGYWCTTKGGFLELHEMARLQGFPDNFIPWKDLGISAAEWGGLLGNAMSLNVVLCLAPEMLQAGGFLGPGELTALRARAAGHNPMQAFH